MERVVGLPVAIEADAGVFPLDVLCVDEVVEPDDALRVVLEALGEAVEVEPDDALRVVLELELAVAGEVAVDVVVVLEELALWLELELELELVEAGVVDVLEEDELFDVLVLVLDVAGFVVVPVEVVFFADEELEDACVVAELDEDSFVVELDVVEVEPELFVELDEVFGTATVFSLGGFGTSSVYGVAGSLCTSFTVGVT